MTKMTKKMTKAEKIENKKDTLMLYCMRQRRDITMYSTLMSFRSLSLENFEKVCEFTDDDWACYGSLKEEEVVDNRCEEDKTITNTTGGKDEDGENEWYLLTEGIYNKVKGGYIDSSLTYNLYVLMRLAEIRR